MTAPTLIAQVTDTHVVEAETDEDLHVDNNGRLAEAVARIGAESPAVVAVLATGDLVNDGRPGEYAELARLLAPLTVPVLAIPGNHDDRPLLRSMFADLPWADADHASWVVDVAGVRVVGLDSTIPGRPGARFDPAREEWLRAVLAEPHGGTTLLTVHHPPFETGIAWMDSAGFDGLGRLASVLAEHPVDRVLCGHLHRPVVASLAGVVVHVAPSTVQSVALDFDPAASTSLILDPAGYLLHRISDANVVSHTRYIGEGAKPFVPAWAQL